MIHTTPHIAVKEENPAKSGPNKENEVQHNGTDEDEEMQEKDTGTTTGQQTCGRHVQNRTGDKIITARKSARTTTTSTAHGDFQEIRIESPLHTSSDERDKDFGNNGMKITAENISVLKAKSKEMNRNIKNVMANQKKLLGEISKLKGKLQNKFIREIGSGTTRATNRDTIPQFQLTQIPPDQALQWPKNMNKNEDDTPTSKRGQTTTMQKEN